MHPEKGLLGDAAEQAELVKIAQKRIRRSWVVTGVFGSAIAILPIALGGVYLLLIPFLYYVVWSWFWGVQKIGPWWEEHIIRGREPGWFSLIIIYSLALYYSIFGGGISQYRIHRKLTNSSSRKERR